MKITIKRVQRPSLLGVLPNVSNLREAKITIKRVQRPSLLGVLPNVSNLRCAGAKKFINYIAVCMVLASAVSCNEKDFAAQEHYKNVVYLLSEGDYNVYPVSYDLAAGDEVTKYFSVGCGGSLSNPEEFVVELEADDVLLGKYNKGNFDINVEKYAKLLPESRYAVETYSVTFPANNEDQYVKVGVTVKIAGLSPDTTYFIPLAIKSVSRYEVNEEKSAVLFRVGLENYFSEQLTETYYQMRGNILDSNGEAVSTVSSTQLVKPLTANSVRLYAGSLAQSSSSTVEEINKQSIVLTVDENNKVTITPYGTIQVEQLEGGSYWNTYEETTASALDTKISKYIYLYYRYRTLSTPATDTSPAVWSNWTTLKETLRRLE